MRVIIVLIAALSITLSALFLNLGWSYPRTENESVVSTGEWIPTDHTSIHESNFSCPNTGELVGNVWEGGGVWKSRTEPVKDSWFRLEKDFKDEDHAKFAAEAFIRKHDICTR